MMVGIQGSNYCFLSGIYEKNHYSVGLSFGVIVYYKMTMLILMAANQLILIPAKNTTTYICFRSWDELICNAQRKDVPGETQIDLLIVKV